MYLKLTAIQLEDLQIVPALEIRWQRWKGIEAASNSRGESTPATEAEHDPRMQQFMAQICAQHRKGAAGARGRVCKGLTAMQTKYIYDTKLIN